jgi:hypothetical protein
MTWKFYRGQKLDKKIKEYRKANATANAADAESAA